jgi:hypothetical protein
MTVTVTGIVSTFEILYSKFGHISGYHVPFMKYDQNSLAALWLRVECASRQP